jgi:UDP-N-acetylglucosamine--N-acetylmuramyl-(pentapeptide) pyrophosphoryl-undecaprenol N-acetylglucosamine transferase
MERILPPQNFTVKAFLQAEELALTYLRTDLAIVRSGCGTIAELALFGIPAIYVPFPHAHAAHQLHNARAIERLGGGTVLEQELLTPEVLEREWTDWKNNAERRVMATNALKSWSKPDAAARVLSVVKEVFDASSN